MHPASRYGADTLKVTRRHLDVLTGLPDRAGAFAALGQRLTADTNGIAVLLCQINGVRAINTAYGQTVGDDALRATAARIAAACTPQDTVTRIGGTEFLVICADVPDAEHALARAAALVSVIEADLRIDGTLTALGATVGVAVATPPATADSLLQDADAAAQEAKRTHRAVVLFRQPVHGAPRQVTQTLAADLRRAIRSGQMTVVYQPLLDTSSGRIIGNEALVRWHHPALGDVSPEEFVPLAEEMGLIGEIGQQVLHAALVQQRAWSALLGDAAPTFVAVNVSAQQLLDPEFVTLVAKALAEVGLPGAALTLEITETVLMADLDASAATLLGLASLGVTLDIDDFGTGYSSLAYLTRLPVHAFKMDKSFVRGLGADERMTTATEALISLGRSLGLRCVAEGVETAEHLAWLRAHGCELAQGYYLSAPAPADEVTDLIASGRRW